MAEAAQNWSDDIKAIGDQIVGLSLLQAKELSDYLKEEHGLEAAAGGAVMMAAPAADGGAAAVGRVARCAATRAADVVWRRAGGGDLCGDA